MRGARQRQRAGLIALVSLAAATSSGCLPLTWRSAAPDASDAADGGDAMGAGDVASDSPVADGADGSDALVDAPAEAGPDATADAPSDAPADTLTDTPTDAPTDTPFDASLDAPTDAPTDAPLDAPADGALTEVGPDAAPEAGPSCADAGPPALMDGGICAADLLVDPRNCGRCGVVCDTGEACIRGTCAPDGEVVAGESFACARVGGQVHCWGVGASGEVGDGRATGEVSCPAIGAQEPRLLPTRVRGIGDARELAAGGHHACARRAGALLSCWGTVPNGITDGDVEDDLYTTPFDVTLAPDGTAAPGHVFLAYGGFACMTYEGCSQLSCWGSNADGALGLNSTSDAVRLRPRPTSLGHVRWMGGGFGHACATTYNGSLECWGTGLDFVNGSPSAERRNAPTPVALPAGERAVDGDASPQFNCVVTTERHVYCFGGNGNAMLARESSEPSSATPLRVDVDLDEPLANAVQVSVGFRSACALLGDGAIVCWGSNGDDGLGTGDLSDPLATPARVVLPDAMVRDRPVSIAVGGAETICAYTRAGTVWCWGGNGSGQVGDGTCADRSAPTRVFPVRP